MGQNYNLGNYAQATGVKMKSEDGLRDLTVQIGELWNISGDYFATEPFATEPFAIKNISEDNLMLTVRLYGMTEFIKTVFYPGWNIELVCEIKGAPAGMIQGGRL